MMNDNSSSCSSDLNPSSSSVRAAASSRPKRRTGRKKFKETRHPVYRGVRRRNNNKWVCELREPIKQKRIWLGTYPTPEMAARAHDLAALALKGNLATLNFADSRWKLPVPVSKDPKDLRQAAVKAAEAFRQDPELVGVDYMNDEVNSRSHEEVNCLETVVNKEMKMEMGSILCCTTNWGDNNEMLEEIEESWQVKMANGPRIGSYFSWDDVEISDVEVSLWSYSV